MPRLAAIDQAEKKPHKYPRPEEKCDDGMEEMVWPVIPLNNSVRNDLGLPCLDHHDVRGLLLLCCMWSGWVGVKWKCMVTWQHKLATDTSTPPFFISSTQDQQATLVLEIG